MNKQYSYLDKRYWLTYLWLASFLIYFNRVFFDFGTITKVAQFMVDAIGLFCWGRCVLEYPTYNKQVKGLLWIVSLLLISLSIAFLFAPNEYYAWLENFEYISTISFYQLVLYSLVSIFPAVYLSKKKLLTIAMLRWFFYVAWPLSILSYFDQFNMLMETLGSERVVNNMAYTVLAIAPFAVNTKPMIKYGYFLSAFVLCMMSGKRGAALLMLLLVALVIVRGMASMKWWKKIGFIGIVMGCFIAVSSYYANDFFVLQERLADGATDSSRWVIWNSIWDSWIQSDSMGQLLFGHGFMSSVKDAGIFAHNDWFEMLLSLGAFGILLLWLLLFVLCRARRYLRYDMSLLTMLDIAIIIMLFKSLVSMGLFSIDGSIFMLVFGYCLCQIHATPKNSSIY